MADSNDDQNEALDLTISGCEEGQKLQIRFQTLIQAYGNLCEESDDRTTLLRERKLIIRKLSIKIRSLYLQTQMRKAEIERLKEALGQALEKNDKLPMECESAVEELELEATSLRSQLNALVDKKLKRLQRKLQKGRKNGGRSQLTSESTESVSSQSPQRPIQSSSGASPISGFSGAETAKKPLVRVDSSIQLLALEYGDEDETELTATLATGALAENEDSRLIMLE